MGPGAQRGYAVSAGDRRQIHSASPLPWVSQVCDPRGRGQACAQERGTGLGQDWFSSEQHIACGPAAMNHPCVPSAGWK